MEKENKKELKQLENLLYKERFQFILQINDDIICQRYFRINGFSYEAFDSLELKTVMDEVVKMIQDNLVSKSRVYDWYTHPFPLKLTGFINDNEMNNSSEYINVIHGEEDVELDINGKVIQKTFFHYPEDTENVYIDNERPSEGEFVFKFSFLFDEKPLYEKVWDGNVYHKYVRNSVDLANSDILYRDKDPLSLHFNIAIIRRMTVDKTDLVYHIIKKICYVLSSSYTDDKNEYTKKVVYKDAESGFEKVYYCSTYNRNFVNDWRAATEQKTKEYMASLYPSARQIEYIDKYL